MPGALRCRTGKQRIIASLMACAPWLPPNTSKVGVPPRLGAISKNACRTGTPVTSAWRKYFAVSSKCTAAAETNRATIRLANPGTTLGSKASVGICLTTAASIAGPEAYPPTPITTSGANWLSMRAARGPDEQDLGAITFLELIGDGQRRDHMSARPAARQDCPHQVTINQKQLATDETDSSDRTRRLRKSVRIAASPPRLIPPAW